jgi:glutamine amidotransferase
MITIIDYGVANLGSMRNMLARIGAEARCAASADEVAAATKLILPGIGAFDHGVSELAKRGLLDMIRERVVEHRVPILGVCLGAQLLGNSSAEGTLGGLELLDFRCERFIPDPAAGIRVPHMGWSHIKPSREDPILRGLDDSARFYFVHSYHLVCKDPADVLATARYGIEFTALVQKGHIYGAQFHPEKSHRFGMQLLRNFSEL